MKLTTENFKPRKLCNKSDALAQQNQTQAQAYVYIYSSTLRNENCWQTLNKNKTNMR